MGGKSGDIPRVSIQFNMMKTPPQIQFQEHSATFKVFRALYLSLVWGQSLMDNGLVSRSHIDT